jgi:protein O-mannosyl-transferase
VNPAHVVRSIASATMAKPRAHPREKPTRPPSRTDFPFALRGWALPGLLALVTLAAYAPALRAGFVWDDDAYVTQNQTLRDLDGLRRIWFELGAVPQYYPLVHSGFWVEHHLWGLDPLGYHLVNVLLHVLAAVLLARVLLRLEVPAPGLAAILFALHPICVESVAWVTERKNVLSAVFYLGAALTYLRFFAATDSAVPGHARWRYYAGALVLFVMALLSKTTTCSLPAALLLVRWWKRGRLRRSDVVPLIPFFVVGAGMGLMTAWIERQHLGAQGGAWSLTLPARCLIAGRALWFYAGKLVWPVGLAFVYPRWDIDVHAWWQWTFPLAAVCAFTGLWLARRRIGRGPVAASLFFAGTLGPALGFFNLYPMRYSFVADHFQYLACIGVLASCAVVLSRLPPALPAALVVVLGVLTWRQASAYHDSETFWRDTLRKNPRSALAHNNLGTELERRGRIAEAMEHFDAARAIAPNDPEPHNNLGNMLLRGGHLDEAIESYRRAIQLDPRYVSPLNSLAVALAMKGNYAEAATVLQRALRLDPNDARAHGNLGNALRIRGDLDGAITHYRDAVRLAPSNASLHDSLGDALEAKGLVDEAVDQYEQALRIDAGDPAAHLGVGRVLARRGRREEAIAQLRETLRRRPDDADARQLLQELGATVP